MARGGKRIGAGRKLGGHNKQTADIKELAEPYGPEAVLVLAAIMRDETHPGRIAATRELLDRAYGKPPQGMTIGNDPKNPIPAGAFGIWFTGSPDGASPPETVESSSNTRH